MKPGYEMVEATRADGTKFRVPRKIKPASADPAPAPKEPAAPARESKPAEKAESSGVGGLVLAVVVGLAAGGLVLGALALVLRRTPTPTEE